MRRGGKVHFVLLEWYWRPVDRDPSGQYQVLEDENFPMAWATCLQKNNAAESVPLM